MSIAPRKRNRHTRLLLDLPQGSFLRLWGLLRRNDVLLRLALSIVAMLAICLAARSWAPPLGYRIGLVPSRNVVAQVAFKRLDPEAWDKARNRAQSREPWVYKNEVESLPLLRAALKNAIAEVVQAGTFAEVNPDTWKSFQPMNSDTPPIADTAERDKEFNEFRAGVGDPSGLEHFEQAVAKAFSPFERHGLLDKLPPEHDEGNQKEIVVYPAGKPSEKYLVPVSDVLIGQAEALHNRLKENLPPAVASRVFYWLKPRLQPTLSLDMLATQAAREAASAAVPEQFTYYEVGKTLAPAGKPIDEPTLDLLRVEHAQIVAELTWPQMVSRTLAALGLLTSVFGLCGYYVATHDRRLVQQLDRLLTLLGWIVATIALSGWATIDPAAATLVPLVLFGVTFGIAYPRDLAMVLSAALSAILAVTSGLGLGHSVILMSVVASAIVQLDAIRSRSKLIQVGAMSAVVALVATVLVGLIEEQPWGWPLWNYAFRNALWTLAAGFLLTGLLPWIEKWFGVLTEISLLEWGDVSHPLLQELVRRAPGTYNHSINVASIAEAAAESIDARGLLVRVGAYFHDIGKMLKPDYYVENQTPGSNRHDALMPAMSTLIIIAHVKDGADLARQHRLPQAIIDFIEQHHGTTLVEYFFRRASEKSGEGAGGEVHENAYRYPGPKPQTIESAVLMLADSVESASRALVEPTPSRIESLVEEIALKKLLDGQFDECGLTLEKLRTIEDSLIKSLTAVYHGRVKYPTQQTA